MRGEAQTYRQRSSCRVRDVRTAGAMALQDAVPREAGLLGLALVLVLTALVARGAAIAWFALPASRQSPPAAPGGLRAYLAESAQGRKGAWLIQQANAFQGCFALRLGGALALVVVAHAGETKRLLGKGAADAQAAHAKELGPYAVVRERRAGVPRAVAGGAHAGRRKGSAGKKPSPRAMRRRCSANARWRPMVRRGARAGTR